MVDVKKVAQFIVADTFWNAFVSEINVNPDKTFDIVPVLGNTVIALGGGDSLPEKFDRLYSFYKQVWTKTGFNRYEKLDVRFYNQVVATKRGGIAAQQKDTATINALPSSRWSARQLQKAGLIVAADTAKSKSANRRTMMQKANNNKKETKNSL